MDTLLLSIQDVRRLTPQAIEITFAAPAADFNYLPGQFLTFLIELDGQTYSRSYSLCSSPYTGEAPKVGIKRVAGGRISNYLNDKAQPGMQIRIQAPAGRFTPNILPTHPEHYVLWAGGSGITPMMSIIKSILHANPEGSITLFYANRDIENIMFRDELTDLAKQHAERFRLHHILEHPPADWQGMVGLLSPERVAQLIEPLSAPAIPHSHWMCGPSPMMEQIQRGYALCSMEQDLHKEIFTLDPANDKLTPGDDSSKQLPASSRITIHFNRESYTFDVTRGQSILDAALAQGIDLPHSCQSGICTTCLSRLKKGKVVMEVSEALTAEELDQGYVLICVGHAASKEVELEIE